MDDRFANHPELKIFGEVWLHGSRRMKSTLSPWKTPSKLPEGTDWDYAAQHNQPWQTLDDLAKRNGWVEVVDKSYMDNNTALVYEKVIEGEKVQVSMRQCLDTYKSCFSGLEPTFYFRYLWKGSTECLPLDQRRNLWNLMYWVYQRGVDSVHKGRVSF